MHRHLYVLRAGRVSLALATSLTFATACGSSTGSGGGGGGDLAMTALKTSYITAFCGVIDRCGVQSGLGPLTYSSAAVCVETITAGGEFEIDEIADVAAGKMVYDGAQASACIAAVNSLACGALDQLEQVAPACQKVFTGALAVGAQCTDSDHCKAGWCKGADEPNSGCPGVCAADKAAGEACDGDNECVEGLSCEADKCAKRVPAKVGEPCASGCDVGLACDNGKTPTCVKLPVAGEACLSKSATAYCSAGLRCAEGTCAAPGAEGATCDVGTHLETGTECAAGLSCGVKLGANGTPESQTCVPIKAPGETCALIFECKGLDQYCKEGKCAPLPKVGEPCADKKVSPFAQCAPSAKCDDKDVCAGQPADAKEGESCEQADCEGDLDCNDKNVCVQPEAPVCQ